MNCTVEHLASLNKKISIVEIETFVNSWWFIWYNKNGVIFWQEASSPAKVSSMIRAYLGKISKLGTTSIDNEGIFFLLERGRLTLFF